jgi:hypothetical protein
MPCPDLGALRASLDDAPGTSAPLHDHVRGCASCLDTLAELRRNAELAAPAIAMTAPEEPLAPAAVEAALARLVQRRARLLAARTGAGPAAVPGPALGGAVAALAPPPRRARLPRLTTRARAAAAGLIAVIVLTGLVATPGGRAAAAGFLAQFRSERFEVISLSSSQARQLNEVMSQLVATGVFSGDNGRLDNIGEPAPVRDLAEASQIAGFPVQAVSQSALPRGVRATPERVLVLRAQTIRVTLDRERALAYFQRNDQPGVQIPPRYDGAQLVVHVPAIVVQEYAGRDGGPRLLAGKAGMIGLNAAGGASLEELRELVLRLPGLPSETVAQLRGISDWRTTLPLPVPVDQASWKPANVNGAEALSFADPSGHLHALVWQRGGNIWGVAGVISAAEAFDVADSLG